MTVPRGRGISRRALLKAVAAVAVGAVLFPALAGAEWKSIPNVVIVRFGGGVRFAETFGDPLLGNLPQIKSLMKEGTVYLNLYNEGDTSHVGDLWISPALEGEARRLGLEVLGPARPLRFDRAGNLTDIAPR